VSEGRRLLVIASIALAAGRPSVQLLDVHNDPDHNRSVITLAGRADALVDGVVAAASTAARTIDLPTHEGVHPRLGAIDVIPFVPVSTDSTGMATAVSAAREAARRVAGEAGIPCFLYEEAGSGRSLPEVRRRAFVDLAPDFGGPDPHPTAGAAAVGARGPMVAYNVDLNTGDLALALPSRGIVQVSTNLLRPAVTTIGAVFEAVAALAAAAGVGVRGSEIVGLTPRAALPTSTAHLLLREPPRILEAELARYMAFPG
jgi:glutamate formiminotransferase